MSDFRFAKTGLPRRMVIGAGYGIIVVITLIALIFLTSARSKRSEMAEMRAIIARADLQSNSGSASDALGADAFYVGDTPQLAQAALQTNLQNLAESYDIDIEVIRADAIVQIDDFVRLNLTLNGIAPETELGNFLYGVSALQPLVVVEELTLRNVRSTRSNAVRRVSFQMQLYGVSQR